MMLTSQNARPAAICRRCVQGQQARRASLLRRPKTPYTFTQLIQLSDGSTFTQRTTSPSPIYRTSKDTKNNPLWNPSSQKLLNIEEDEAGRLRRFRGRFGRGWDAETMDTGKDEAQTSDGAEGLEPREPEESLLDLISGYKQEAQKKGEAAGAAEQVVQSGKGKGGQK